MNYFDEVVITKVEKKEKEVSLAGLIEINEEGRKALKEASLRCLQTKDLFLRLKHMEHCFDLLNALQERISTESCYLPLTSPLHRLAAEIMDEVRERYHYCLNILDYIYIKAYPIAS